MASDKPLPIRLIWNIILSIILFVGLIFLILWLSLRPHRPNFHVQDFYIVGLDQPNGLEAARVGFNVMIRNENLRVGINYRSMYGVVYYKNERIGSTLPLHSFYQGPKNTTFVHQAMYGTSLGVNSQRWMEFMSDRSHGIVAFRLELVSVMKYTSMWDTGSHRIRSKCNVAVSSNGSLLPEYVDSKCSK